MKAVSRIGGPNKRNKNDSSDSFAPILKSGESKNKESHQYEPDESEVWRHHQMQRHFEDRWRFWTFDKQRVTIRWWMTMLTGITCGLVALFVTYFTKLFTGFKFQVFHDLIEKEKINEYSFGTSFLVLWIFNTMFAIIAWSFCYAESLASGSGIPEIKCFLNGLNIPRLVDFKTLLTKVFGIIFSCSAGLPLGKEGPMVHAGAVLAGSISQSKNTWFGLPGTFSRYQDFRNDKEKRDFVACGAAAGVAAAFGAPIGGVLFSLEEGASFWSTRLTWRSFFCTMTTIFTMSLINNAQNSLGHSSSNGMFNFGEFFSLYGEGKSNFSIWELFIFAIIGAMGGLVGAMFVTYNERIHLWRNNNRTTSKQKLIEVIILATIMTALSAIIPLVYNICTPLPVDMEEWSRQEKSNVDELIPLYCTKGTHYNEVASLYLTDSDTAIKQLFHFREIGDHNDSTFSSLTISLFFVPYIIMACLTCGSSVPAGMFVPSLLSGAAFGRLIGHLLHKLDNTNGTFADSGTYALMGAAAVTSGISRITISLTIMILEATRDMQYVLPIMLTVMSARLVGNIFTHGLYDVHIKCKGLMFLEEDDELDHVSAIEKTTVSSIMTCDPVCLLPVVRVGDVLDLLDTCSYQYFPVVESGSAVSPPGMTQQLDAVAGRSGFLLGLVSRNVICTLIKYKAYSVHADNPSASKNPEEGDNRDLSSISPLISWQTIERLYPNFPTIDEVSHSVTDAERQLWIDLQPYVDTSAHRICDITSIPRTYRVFRTLGLHHLCVVNRYNRCIGILSRSDLVHAYHGGNSSHGLDSAAAADTEWMMTDTDNDNDGGGNGNIGNHLRSNSIVDNPIHHHDYSPNMYGSGRGSGGGGGGSHRSSPADYESRGGIEMKGIGSNSKNKLGNSIFFK